MVPGEEGEVRGVGRWNQIQKVTPFLHTAAKWDAKRCVFKNTTHTKQSKAKQRAKEKLAFALSLSAPPRRVSDRGKPCSFSIQNAIVDSVGGNFSNDVLSVAFKKQTHQRTVTS